MSGIRLHATKGVNAFLTFCRKCKGEASELILVGADDGVYVCQCRESEGGPHRHIGSPKGATCVVSGHESRFTLERRLEEGERLPASDLCDACKKEKKEHAEIVEAGGVYWECEDCPASGVVKGTSPFAQMVRKAHDLPAPAPCGVQFTKKDCPACGPDAAMHREAAEKERKEREEKSDGKSPADPGVPPPG